MKKCCRRFDIAPKRCYIKSAQTITKQARKERENAGHQDDKHREGSAYRNHRTNTLPQRRWNGELSTKKDGDSSQHAFGDI